MPDLSDAEREAMEKAFSAIEEQMPALGFTGGEAERTALFEGLWLAARDARDQEIERLTEQRERVATTRNELHQKLERADSAVMRWRRYAVAAEAQVRELREALEMIAKNDEGWGVGLSRKPSAIARAALASSESKGPPLRGRKSQWRWWCSSCKRYTDIAPCKHCGAGHDEVLVLEPGQEPPSLKVVEADGWPTVEDFEWPPETYLNVEQGGDDD